MSRNEALVLVACLCGLFTSPGLAEEGKPGPSAAPAAETAAPSARRPMTLSDVAGSWNMSLEVTGGNCAGASLGTILATSWIVSGDAAGTLSISVQGENMFTHLDGAWYRDGDVRAAASGETHLPMGCVVMSSALYELRSEAGKLVGVMTFAGNGCFVRYKATGTR